MDRPREGAQPLPRAAAVTTCIASAIVLVGTFLPWLRSGERGRSSYALYGVVRSMELGTGTATRAALELWPAVPLLLTLTIAAIALGRGRAAGVCALATASYVGIAILTAARMGLAALPGMWLVAIGAGGMVAGGLALIVCSEIHRQS